MVYFDRIFGLCGSFPAWDKSRNSRIKPTSYGNIYYIRNDKFSDDGTVAIYLLVRNIPILMADEVVVMTAKPKTGKMTDSELIDEYLGKDIRASGDFSYSELLKLMAQARQQGIEPGRALEDSECHQAILDSHEREKRAYANGFKEGEIKGLSESITVKGKSHLSYYQQGYALGQSDLKARLMNYSKGNVVYGSSMNAKQIIKQALDEATKDEKVGK